MQPCALFFLATNILSICRQGGLRRGWSQDRGMVAPGGVRLTTSGKPGRNFVLIKESEATGRDSHASGTRGGQRGIEVSRDAGTETRDAQVVV